MLGELTACKGLVKSHVNLDSHMLSQVNTSPDSYSSIFVIVDKKDRFCNLLQLEGAIKRSRNRL